MLYFRVKNEENGTSSSIKNSKDSIKNRLFPKWTQRKVIRNNKINKKKVSPWKEDGRIALWTSEEEREVKFAIQRAKLTPWTQILEV